jgi:hypothetical protein
MDTTTTDNFTKELFYALRLEWSPFAEARLLLSDIISEEESFGSILEDCIYSLSQFLDKVREDRNIPNSENKIVPFIIQEDNNYCLHIGNDSKSNIVFVVTIECKERIGFVFQRALDYERVEHNPCFSLDELKFHLLLWFNEFYEKFEEGTL